MNPELRALFAEVRDRLSRSAEFPFAGRLAIYGAGNLGRATAEALASQGVEVVCFFDRASKSGESAGGVPVLHPEENDLTMSMRAELPVLVAIFNSDVDVMTIVEELRALGFTWVTTVIEQFDHLEPLLGQRFWLTSPTSYLSVEDDVIHGESVWADAESRDLYSSVVRSRLLSELPPGVPSRGTQYLPDQFIPANEPVRFIDCGAFTGDTAEHVLASGRALDSWAAFEPDPANFEELAQFAEGRASDIPEAYLWPCAVHSMTTTLSFSGGNGESSRVSDSGDRTVQAVALDDVLGGFGPTLLKMDVEGSEENALIGARRLISEARPRMAIALYHLPEHLWTIPRMLSAWDLEYDLHLLSHGFCGFELIMYAIPRGPSVRTITDRKERNGQPSF